MSLVKGIHHVKLQCTPETFDQVLHFYLDIIGLRLLSRHGDSAIMTAGNTILEVFNDSDYLMEQGYFKHIAFATDDAAKCIRTVEAAGYKIKEYPIHVMFGLEEDTPATIAFCYGPIGEEIEFFQVGWDTPEA